MAGKMPNKDIASTPGRRVKLPPDMVGLARPGLDFEHMCNGRYVRDLLYVSDDGVVESDTLASTILDASPEARAEFTARGYEVLD